MNVFYTLKNGLNGKFYVTCTLPQYRKKKETGEKKKVTNALIRNV